MRGFIVGTIVTAIAFFVLTRSCRSTRVRHGHLRRRTRRAARPVAHLRRRQRPHRADRADARPAAHVHDAGPDRVRHQRRPAAADGVSSPTRPASTSRSATSRRTCCGRHDRRGHRRGGRPEHRQHRRRGLSSRTDHAAPTGLPAVADRAARRRPAGIGTPAYVTDLADARRGGGGRPRRVPGPVDPRSTRSRPTTSRRSWRRSTVARVRGQRRVARRMGGRPQGRRARTSGSRSRASARPTRTCGPRSARPRSAARRCAGSRSSRADEAEVLDRDGPAGGLGRGGRPPLDVLRPAQPRRHARDACAGLAVGAGALQVRDDRDRGDRRWSSGWRAGRRARVRPARDPPPRRLAARRGRCVARRGAARARGRRPCCAAALDGLRHARRRRRVPGPAAGRAGARTPERFAREIPELLEALPRRTAGRRASRSNPAGRSWRAPAGWWPASSTSASAAAARSSSTPG